MYSLVTGSGSPALGFTTSGSLVYLPSSSTTGYNSSGPNEQLTPSASTPSPSIVSAIEDTWQPVKVLIFCSKVIVQIIGSSVFSFAASTAALSSNKSVIVSNTMTSASRPAITCSLYISYASSNFKSPVGSTSLPIGPKSSATMQSVPSHAFLAFSIPFFMTCSTV